jgi:disulfide bond formation protein DsbB
VQARRPQLFFTSICPNVEPHFFGLSTTMPSSRLILFAISFFCACAIGVALYMQHVLLMEPCALCISQRIFIIAVGVLSLLTALLSGHKIVLRCLSALSVVVAAIGGAISARHIWIQNLPEDQVPECGPGLAYMFETRPIFDALSVLLRGDGHCADVHFSFLGLSIPGWTLISFVGMATLLVCIFVRSIKNGASSN